jgi:hypothetical protein
MTPPRNATQIPMATNRIGMALTSVSEKTSRPPNDGCNTPPALIFATMSLVVPIGTIKAFQLVTSIPGMPASEVVGTSGNSKYRFSLVTARARSFPDFTCGRHSGTRAKISSI